MEGSALNTTNQGGEDSRRSDLIDHGVNIANTHGIQVKLVGRPMGSPQIGRKEEVRIMHLVLTKRNKFPHICLFIAN